MARIRINLSDLRTESPHDFVSIDPDRAECMHCGVVKTPENTNERCISRERHGSQEGNPFKSDAERRAWEEPSSGDSN